MQQIKCPASHEKGLKVSDTRALGFDAVLFSRSVGREKRVLVLGVCLEWSQLH